MSSGIENQPRASEQEVFAPYFAREAAVHGILHTPEVIQLHNLCITTEFTDDTAYNQGLLALLHACDMATSDQKNDTELRGIAFCLADVHFQTEHYGYCLGELKFIEQNLVRAETSDDKLLAYVQSAIDHVSTLISPASPLVLSPVNTNILSN